MINLTKYFTADHNFASSVNAFKCYYELIDRGIDVDPYFAYEMFLVSSIMGGEI